VRRTSWQLGEEHALRPPYLEGQPLAQVAGFEQLVNPDGLLAPAVVPEIVDVDVWSMRVFSLPKPLPKSKKDDDGCTAAPFQSVWGASNAAESTLRRPPLSRETPRTSVALGPSLGVVINIPWSLRLVKLANFGSCVPLVVCINGFACSLDVVVLSLEPRAAGHKKACPIMYVVPIALKFAVSFTTADATGVSNLA
jgi:hypothetical protein